MRRRWQRAARATTAAFVLGCGTSNPLPATGETTGEPPAGDTTSADSTFTSDDSEDTGGETTGPTIPPLPDVWQPGVLLPSDDEPHARGWLDRRGLIHTHSPFSHDACDGMPRDEDGNVDAICMDDLRRSLCQIQHDYVMFTDHRDSFSSSEFPEVLLVDQTRGDVLLEREGKPVGNWAGCEDFAPGTPPTLLLAGCESAIMPVGLTAHAPGRGETYGSATPEAIAELHEAGGVVLVAHTEEWSVEELISLPLDGFEMYNLHANLFDNLAAGLQIIDLQRDNPDGLPHSDLIIMPIWSEHAAYLERWGTVLARGTRRVTTAATDAHRNTFPEVLPDGERIDSYRRMMHWFSNHLLVTDDGRGGFDDRDLTEALGAGRLYAAFEYLGYPRGFDAYAERDGVITEIGGEVTMADGLQIVANAPTVRRLDPQATAPEITLVLLRAIEGGFEEVATGTDTLSWTVDAPGAYRVEVRMVPRHLAGYLGSFEALSEQARVWIYANPVYVRAR